MKSTFVLLAAGLAASFAVSAAFYAMAQRDDHSDHPDLVRLAPGTLSYRPAGDFSKDGKPATAPKVSVAVAIPVEIMRRQVTAAEYRKCVDDGHCRKLAQSSPAWDRPVVGVSWRDADAYAKWLSQKTGRRYRLPTDEEWAYAAGTRFRDDTVTAAEPNDPAARWLAHYEQGAQRDILTEKEPQPVGAFGANEHGLLDVGGNVWEWTESCFVRASLEQDGYRTGIVNCGVRVVEGAHRSYMTDFIRDARMGGCAVGAPPANLGFRLVRDTARPTLASVFKWIGTDARADASKRRASVPQS